jgi:hypothetical protein
VKRRLALLAILISATTLAPTVAAYLKNGGLVNGRLVSIKWSPFPVNYFVTNRDISGVSAVQLQGVLDRAFRSWGNVPSLGITAQFGGFVNLEPSVDDGVTVLGFQNRPELDRVLGATRYQFNNGQYVSADIFFNSFFTWSVAQNGEGGRFDVESVALHEIGHLLGLGHSALGETQPRVPPPGRDILGKRAVMFPIAYPRGNIEDRTLEADDVSGITDIYSNSDTNRRLGSIAGKVTLNGAGLFGAHVTAFNSGTNALVGGFALNQQGDFVIGALEPGLYIVRVEPLDDADIDSFFDPDTVVNINFKPAYYEKLVAVPAGGTSGTIEIKVQSK